MLLGKGNVVLCVCVSLSTSLFMAVRTLSLSTWIGYGVRDTHVVCTVYSSILCLRLAVNFISSFYLV